MASNTALAGNQQPQQQQQAVNKPAAGKQGNVLPLWGNEKTMNLNPMILTNVLSSPYFKVQLYELKTYHEVVDEIYFKVTHVEPWEKGSRKTAGQTGMCGGVRGVGTGGIVSTAFCLLYKLFTLKLTRKQVMGLITHTDSPYIRALGFMYIRYTQPPSDLLDWFDGFLDDEEELDVKAGGGCVMTMGEMLRSFLTKLEWFSTLFPRIPVPVQKMIDQQIKSRPRKVLKKDGKEEMEVERYIDHRHSRSPRRTPTPRRSPKRSRSKSHHRDGHGSGSFDWQLERERERQRKEREVMDRDRVERDRGAKEQRRSRSPERVSELHGSRGRDRRRSHSASRDKKNERLERESDGDRNRRKGRDYEKDRTTDRDHERSRDRRAKGEAEDRKHREEHDDKRHKDKRRAKKPSGIWEGRHRSRNRGAKRSRSKSKEGPARQRPERPGSRASRSRGRADGEDRARKRERSRSKEHTHQREHGNGKEQPGKHEHGRSHGMDPGNGAPRTKAESS